MLDNLWRLPEVKRVKIAILWWHWWNNRNKLGEGELSVPVLHVAKHVRSEQLEYVEAFMPAPSLRDGQGWKPPAEAMIKINADGALSTGESHAGWGSLLEILRALSLLPVQDGRMMFTTPLGPKCMR
ncbi:hypothetical protein D1007_56685 [Hordeum vulgare]|nr:hypothetical protein D1007_56685 [Hordeum vulgare]